MKSLVSIAFGALLPVSFLTACSGSGGASPKDGGKEGAVTDAGHDSGPPPPADTGPPVCMDSRCYPGNQCLPDETGKVQCQLPCAAQPGQPPPAGADAGACPFNYTCTDFPAGTPAGSPDRSYCVPDKNQYTQGKGGLWGASCVPSGGIMSNPACDSSQNFWCYARSPADGEAYCTQFQCKTDADCRGGWWCATINLEPNAQSNARRTDGATITACQPRNYCSSCTSDLDCDSTTGIPEHCIKDKKGASYCTPECKADSNCNTEAQCLTLSGGGACAKGQTCVCEPRAQECTGDGKLCAPCLSDADCKAGGGLCLNADYSTEKFCSVPSGPKQPTCSVGTSADGGAYLIADCPTTDEAPNSPVIGCLTSYDLYNPPNQCVGFTKFGPSPYTAYVLGCWTPQH